MGTNNNKMGTKLSDQCKYLKVQIIDFNNLMEDNSFPLIKRKNLSIS